MSTDAATPETPVPPDPDGATDGSAGDGPTSGDTAPGDTDTDVTDSGDTASGPTTSGDTTSDETAAEPASAEPTETDAGGDDTAAAGADPAGDQADDAPDDRPDDRGGDVPALARIPTQAGPERETTRATSRETPRDTGPGPGPVADDAGGRLTARLREARARLQPEQTVIPAPRTPEGVVPPAPFSRGDGPPPPDLLRAVDELSWQLAELEDDEQAPDRQALLRALDRSVAGVPDGGWSGEDRLDAEALADASALAVTLHDAAAALLERLDAEERTGSAVEVDAVATALQVARMVLDLEGFARHGR